MAATVQEVIAANFVLLGCHLLDSPDALSRFKGVVGTDVQTVAVGFAINPELGRTEPGQTLKLNRDRITMELHPLRSAIVRDYPSREDLDKLAEVIWWAICETAVEDRSSEFGFNIELVFRQDSGKAAFGYLADRMIDADDLGEKEWSLVGAAGKMIFADGIRQWTFQIEPRFGEPTEGRVFLSANLHVREHLLKQDVIRDGLESVWDTAYDFVQRLDSVEGRLG